MNNSPTDHAVDVRYAAWLNQYVGFCICGWESNEPRNDIVDAARDARAHQQSSARPWLWLKFGANFQPLGEIADDNQMYAMRCITGEVEFSSSSGERWLNSTQSPCEYWAREDIARYIHIPKPWEG